MNISFTHFSPQIVCNVSYFDDSLKIVQKIKYVNLRISTPLFFIPLKGFTFLSDVPLARRDMNNKMFKCRYQYASNDYINEFERNYLRGIINRKNFKYIDKNQPKLQNSSKFICKTSLIVECECRFN